jgi:hypothetical protein
MSTQTLDSSRAVSLNDFLKDLSKHRGDLSISNDFKQRLHSLTIDQLKHEEHIIEQSISLQENTFSNN